MNNHMNSFSQTEEVWINETCLKAKIKASAWKTIRKTQYSCYENYFQVFRCFSKKSYPQVFRNKDTTSSITKIRDKMYFNSHYYGWLTETFPLHSWSTTLVICFQSINQSFILTRYVEELENLFKIQTCINEIYNNYSYVIIWVYFNIHSIIHSHSSPHTHWYMLSYFHVPFSLFKRRYNSHY